MSIFDSPGPDPAMVARTGLYELVNRVRVEKYGPPGPPVRDAAVRDIVAARIVRDAAEQQMRRSATKAREQGVSWVEIAEALPVGDLDDPPAEAFYWVAGPPSMPFDPVSVSWECGSCGKRIKDSGPHSAHPADCESGHADDCARHNAEVLAYRLEAGFE